MKLPIEINARGKLVEKLKLTAQQQIISQYISSTVTRQWSFYLLPPEDKVFGERVTVPEFEIYENPTIKISDVKRRRFNIIDRGRKKLFINNRGKLVHE